MAQMTDKQRDEAIEMCRALARFLDKHGSDGDEFTTLYAALDELRGRWAEEARDNGQFGVGA